MITKQRQYIGIINWADDSGVLDNTTVGGMHSVWKQCCQAHKIHSGRITIHRAEFDDDGNIASRPVKEFVNVADCIEQYNKEFNK